VHEAHRPAVHLFPGPQPLLNRGDRRERLDAQVDVDLAAAEVVDDDDVVPAVSQVDRTGPTAEAVAAENENLHPCLLNEPMLSPVKLLQASGLPRRPALS